MEDLTRSWSSLTLSECEGSNLRISEEQAVTEYILAAKFLTKRALNIDALAKTFTPLWKSVNGFKIKKEGDHVVLFTFDKKEEMEKVMAAEPWSFDKHLVVLQHYDRDTDVKDMEFNRTSFWVQVHDLPVRFRRRKVAEQICEAAGRIDASTNDSESEGDNFMRVRVSVHITQPLCRGRVISLDNGKELWVSFKYERIPNLCYWCGSLMHNDRDCSLWIESEGTLQNEAQQFGPWIKAAPFVSTRRHTIKVPGFFASRKAGASTSTSNPVRKAPVVVVRSGKPSPEIIHPDKESVNTFPSADTAPDFQEVNRENLAPIESENITNLENPKLKDLGEINQLAGDFEEEIEVIDKEIRRFDLDISNVAVNRACPGKENIIEPPSAQVSNEMFPHAHAQLNHSLPRAPLAVISNNQNRPMHAEGSWKRIARAEIGTDIVMAEAVGEKRVAGAPDDLLDLPKKRKVSQAGKTKTQILAEAGIQPCQKQ